jgi:hypothetical protein
MPRRSRWKWSFYIFAIPDSDSEEAALEAFVTLARCIESLPKLGLAADGVQERICCDIGIGKEARLHATTQHTEGGSLISQNSIRLRSLVRRFGITDSAFYDLAFQAARRASERPGLRDLWPTRLLANFWQNGFLMTSPLEGESENRRVFTDLNGGPGWT